MKLKIKQRTHVKKIEGFLNFRISLVSKKKKKSDEESPQNLQNKFTSSISIMGVSQSEEYRKKHKNLSLNNSWKGPKSLKRYGLTAFKENIFNQNW